MTSANVDQLIQDYRNARTAQEQVVQRLRGTGQGAFDQRNQEMLDAARATNRARAALQGALPPGQTVESVLGETAAPAANAQTPSSPGTSVPTGTNSYIKQILDANRIGDIKFNIVENPLNNLDRYTYHFCLYLVSDTDAQKPDIGNLVFTGQVPRFILAKSGVTTGFNIVDVEIKDSVSSNFRNRNNATTELNMTITEPYGMTLVDKMFLASQQLGVKNWRMAPMILTLEIRGLNADSTPSSRTLVQKFYSILITDMDSTLTQSGSTYKIRATVQNSLGFRDQYYMLPTNLTLTVGPNGGSTTVTAARPGNNPAAPTTPPPDAPVLDGTVGQFFTTLGNLMSQFYLQSRLESTSGPTTPIVVYEFFTDPRLAQQKINMSAFGNRRRGGYSGAQNTQAIHINRVGISELVDDVLSSIENESFFTANQQVGTIRVPRVECIVEYIGWDELLNDYIKKFKFVIGILETIRPVPTVAHGEYFQLNPQNARQRLEGMAEQNIVRKVYPYLYTGMNTEVIKLDLTFNQLHIIPLPLHNGQTITPTEGQSTAQRIQTLQRRSAELESQIQNIENERTAALERLRQLNRNPQEVRDPEVAARLEQQAIMAPIDQTNAAAARESAISSVRQTVAGNISLIGVNWQSRVNELDQVQREINELRTGGITLYNPDSVPPSLRTRANLTPDSQQRAQQAAALQQQQARTRAGESRLTRFVEDIPINQTDPGRLSYAASPADIANNLARPSNVQDAQQAAVRGLYSTILAQLYDRVGLQLTEIEMEIVGDPYWLGQSNLERINELTEFIRTGGIATSGAGANTLPTATGITPRFGERTTTDSNSPYANYYGKDEAFILLFRAGNSPSEDTGYMNFDRNSAENQSVFFNGIYTAIEVTHLFADGKFTQRILAIRDSLTNFGSVAQAPSAPRAGTGEPSAQANAQPAANTPQQAQQQASPATPVAPAANPAAVAAAAQESTPPVTPPAAPVQTGLAASILRQAQAGVQTTITAAPRTEGGSGSVTQIRTIANPQFSSTPRNPRQALSQLPPPVGE